VKPREITVPDKTSGCGGQEGQTMAGMLKTASTTTVLLAAFAMAINMFFGAWPAWALVLIGFLGGNMIVALSTLAFVNEWWIKH
jgi:ABC-type sulfate transport system permease subunit